MKVFGRPFGKGRKVSLFTLGTMRAIGSKEEMQAVLKTACISGINHLETSPTYGQAEKFLGSELKALRQKGIQPEGGWVITSKLLPGFNLSKSKDQLKDLLSRLGISKIDNLALHGLNLPEHLHWSLNEEGSEFLHWAKEEQLVDQVGFSSHGNYSLIEKAIDSNRFDFCSLHLHLLDPERIPLAKKALGLGMGVMAISPADKGGRLYAPSQALVKDCNPVEPLELAYRFLIAEGISTLTVGASKPKDLRIAKKLNQAIGKLKEYELQAINQLLSERSRRLGNSQCGQCRKCLPCPQEVPITDILRLRNLAIGHEMEVFAKERYNLIGKAGHWWESKNAQSCATCGECLPKCPLNLPIPQLLAETHEMLADSPRRRLWG